MLRYMLLCPFLLMGLAARAGDLTVLFGTDSNPDSHGIYRIQFDAETGKWAGRVELAAPLRSAGFQALHPGLPVLYTAGMLPGSGEQQVSAFRMDRSEGELSLLHLNSVPTDCDLVTHLAVDPLGKLLVTAYYKSGKVAVFPIQEDGTLKPQGQIIDHGAGSGAKPGLQDQAHPHCVVFSPDGRFVLVSDLGTDAVHVYTVDRENCRLVPHQKAPAPPGSGPRHLKFSPNGRFAMVLNELALTVSTYAWDQESGTLQLLQVTPTLPEAVKQQEIRNTASELAFHPSGRFLYSANRGNDSITAFKVDPGTGMLEVLEVEPTRTAWPRHFALDSSGRWLVCGGQDGSTAGVFAIAAESGLLTYQPGSSIVVPHPICVTFLTPGD